MALDEKPQWDVATELAKLTVIRHIIATLASDGERIGGMWEDYPLIGENDWIEICQRVTSSTDKQRPNADAFRAAYTHLASRADH